MSLELEKKDISKKDDLDNLIRDLNTVDRSILAAFIKEKMPKRDDCTASATVIMNDNLITDGSTDEEVGCDPVDMGRPTKELVELMTSTIFGTVSEMDSEKAYKLFKLIKESYDTFPELYGLNKDEEVLLMEIAQSLKGKALPMDNEESDFKPSFDSNGIKSALIDLEKAERLSSDEQEKEEVEKSCKSYQPPFKPMSGVRSPKMNPLRTKPPSKEIDWEYVQSKLNKLNKINAIKVKSLEELEIEYTSLHALIRKSKYKIKLLKLAIRMKQEDGIFKLEDDLIEMQKTNSGEPSCYGR
jgi:hypothetical protein